MSSKLLMSLFATAAVIVLVLGAVGLLAMSETVPPKREPYVWSCEARDRQVWELLDIADLTEVFGDEKESLLWRKAAAEDWEKPCKR